MKKILIINTKYRKFGGEDSNIHDEISLLSQKYEVKYLEYDNNERISIYDFLSLFFNGNYKSNNKLKECINSFSPDIAYVHNLWFKGNIGVLKILKKNNIKTYHKFHNYRLSCSSSFLIKKHLNGKPRCDACNLDSKKFQFFNKYYKNSYIKSLFLIIFSKNSIKFVKKYKLNILVLNEFHKNYLLKFGLEPNQIKVFYNPINFQNFKYNSQSNYVLYAGLVSKEKGVLELIQAWNEAKMKNLILKIAGETKNLSIDDLGIQNKSVEILGHVPHTKLLNIMKNSRAVITATKLFEGQPRLICEASSFGVPSIYPSFGGMDEYFPTDYPLVFEQYNYQNLVEIIKKLENVKLLTESSLKVHEFTKNLLNSEKMLQKFEDIINI